MTEKSAPKKKYSSWIGLAFALAALVLVGYLWYGPNHKSKVGPEQRPREIREKTVKKHGYVSTRPEEMRQSGSEKNNPYSLQGGKPDARGKRDSARNGSLFAVAPDAESTMDVTLPWLS